MSEVEYKRVAITAGGLRDGGYISFTYIVPGIKKEVCPHCGKNINE